MENEIKPMTKKELIRRIEEYKPKYIYQRYNGEIRQFEVVNDNYLVDTKSGMSFDFRSHLMLGKVSENLIDIIEVGDYVNGEIIDQIQNDRNPKLIWHLSSYGDDDMAFKNEDIETVVTKEMMESISYKVKRKD